MALWADDVSEYVGPGDATSARLVVEIGAAETKGNSHPVTAQVNDGPSLSGQFAPPQEWAQGRTDSPAQAISQIFPGDNAGARVGTQLFSALFSGGLSRAWAQAVDQARIQGGLQVVIRSGDQGVQALPWEMLSDPIAASRPLTLTTGWSVVRQFPRPPDNGVPMGIPVATSDLQVLVLTADPGGIPQDKDPEIIFDSFHGAGIEILAHINHEAMAGALPGRDWHLLHVLASGVRVRGGGQELMIGPAENPQPLTVREFETALPPQRGTLRLVVLAACNSDTFAAELARTVPNVIGIRSAISNEGCLAFLRGLYRALGSGSTIDQAVAAGRAQLIGFSQSLGDEWALPVLFLGDATPLVSRVQADSFQPAAEPVVARSGTSEQQADQILLDMKQANLRAMREQWGNVGTGSTPRFILEQIDSLDAEVRRIAGKGREPEA